MPSDDTRAQMITFLEARAQPLEHKLSALRAKILKLEMESAPLSDELSKTRAMIEILRNEEDKENAATDAHP